MENRPIDHGYVPPPPETHQHFLILSLPMGFVYASAVAWTAQEMFQDYGPWVKYPMSFLAFLAVVNGHQWEWRPHGGLPWWLKWAGEK